MVTRRLVLGGLVAFAAPGQAFAEQIIDIEWDDLLPKDATRVPRPLRGMIDHDQAPLISQQPASSGVRTDWNGKTIRMPGFVVPLAYKGEGVVAFLLVPFVGACVHVPPPPANQMVLVTSERPYELRGPFDSVYVTGMFGVASQKTQLAEVGYALSADKIEPYG